MGSPEDTVPFDALFERALRSSRNLSDPFHVASGTDRGRRPARNQRPAPQVAQHRRADRPLGQSRNSSSRDPQAGQRRSSDEAQEGTPGAAPTTPQARSAAANETSKVVSCRTYPLSAALAIKAAVALTRAAVSAVLAAFPGQSPKNLEHRAGCKQIGVFAETTQITRLQLEEQPRASSCVQKARGDPQRSAGTLLEPQLVVRGATVGQRPDERSCAFASE